MRLQIINGQQKTQDEKQDMARQVMEETPHIMLSGDGALQFALQQGFKEENMLTDEQGETENGN